MAPKLKSTNNINQRAKEKPSDFLLEIISKQNSFEKMINKKNRKSNGVFFTNEVNIVNQVMSVIDFNHGVVKKNILDPACGNGIFLIRIIEEIYNLFPSQDIVKNFIKQNLIFVDIENKMVENTKCNIRKLYKHLFNTEYLETFNAYTYDFTQKFYKNCHSLFRNTNTNHPLSKFMEDIDYVVGNPPYVTLYGRRDKKKNEEQRVRYLQDYAQFPSSVKNGKINLVMLFLEHSLDFLKSNGKLCFVIDISFFETAYKYTRKFLLENSSILSIDYNISGFADVNSGQIVIKLRKEKGNDYPVAIRNYESNEIMTINQSNWNKPDDEYKFRFNKCEKTDNIIEKIHSNSPKTLKELYPKKNLRTCAMLLDMEDKFVFNKLNAHNNLNIYPYYQGAKGLRCKYGRLYYKRYFYYNRELQVRINDKLKLELTKKGIKNKKRIGLGETIIYDNPKVYIRQSAKEIISSYEENKSAANNSLYVFSLRSNSNDSKMFLKFLCGFLNSDLVTFYAQKRNIIRYSKGKQPQIKISDLYTVRIPTDIKLQKKISDIVSDIYRGVNLSDSVSKIDDIIYSFYRINKEEINFINNSIKCLLKS
jgi:methylase of polypeptide subunit release factors